MGGAHGWAFRRTEAWAEDGRWREDGNLNAVEGIHLEKGLASQSERRGFLEMSTAGLNKNLEVAI